MNLHLRFDFGLRHWSGGPAPLLAQAGGEVAAPRFPTPAQQQHQRFLLCGLIVVLLVIAVIYRTRKTRR